MESALSFPWKRTYRTEDDLRYAFEALKAYKPNVINAVWRNPFINGVDLTFEGKPIIIKHDKAEYDLFDWIADYFVEKYRLGTLGILANWQERKIECFDEWFSKRDDQSTIEELACMLTVVPGSTVVATGEISNELNALRCFLQKKFREPSTFKPTILTTFIDWFSAKLILDTSAGYGERLIAALSRNVTKYLGMEDDPQLAAHHREIISTLASSNTYACVVPKDFLKARVRGMFDLVFVCFNSKSKFQLGYKRELHYKRGVLKKAWMYLQLGGHLVLYHSNNVEPILDIIYKSLSGAGYVGVVASVETSPMGNNIPQPCWIFRKYPVYYS